ncbi:VSR7 [Symbiodinium sp. CCMP2592]|nr:VSR7 [Symbiodinium sp. CCMP2592]
MLLSRLLMKYGIDVLCYPVLLASTRVVMLKNEEMTREEDDKREERDTQWSMPVTMRIGLACACVPCISVNWLVRARVGGERGCFFALRKSNAACLPLSRKSESER